MTDNFRQTVEEKLSVSWIFLLLLGVVTFSLNISATPEKSIQAIAPNPQCQKMVEEGTLEPKTQSLLGLFKNWLSQQRDPEVIRAFTSKIAESATPMNPFEEDTSVKETQLSKAVDRLLSQSSLNWDVVKQRLLLLVQDQEEENKTIETIDEKAKTPVDIRLVDSFGGGDIHSFGNTKIVKMKDGLEYLLAEVSIGKSLPAPQRSQELHIYKIDPMTGKATLNVKRPLNDGGSNVQNKDLGLNGEISIENFFSKELIVKDNIHFFAQVRTEQGYRMIEVDIRDGSFQIISNDPMYFPKKIDFEDEKYVYFTSKENGNLGFHRMEKQTGELQTFLFLDYDAVTAMETHAYMSKGSDGIIYLTKVTAGEVGVYTFSLESNNLVSSSSRFLGDSLNSKFDKVSFYQAKDGRIYMAGYNYNFELLVFYFDPDLNEINPFEDPVVTDIATNMFHFIFFEDHAGHVGLSVYEYTGQVTGSYFGLYEVHANSKTMEKIAFLKWDKRMIRGGSIITQIDGRDYLFISSEHDKEHFYEIYDVEMESGVVIPVNAGNLPESSFKRSDFFYDDTKDAAFFLRSENPSYLNIYKFVNEE